MASPWLRLPQRLQPYSLSQTSNHRNRSSCLHGAGEVSQGEQSRSTAWCAKVYSKMVPKQHCTSTCNAKTNHPHSSIIPIRCVLVLQKVPLGKNSDGSGLPTSLASSERLQDFTCTFTALCCEEVSWGDAASAPPRPDLAGTGKKDQYTQQFQRRLTPELYQGLVERAQTLAAQRTLMQRLLAQAAGLQ